MGSASTNTLNQSPFFRLFEQSFVSQPPFGKPALTLDDTDAEWPCHSIDVLFTANTLDIMSGDEVQLFFDRLAVNLNPKVLMVIDGPFNYNGAYTRDNSARFDQWLKNQNATNGIKDCEDLLFLSTSKGGVA